MQAQCLLRAKESEVQLLQKEILALDLLVKVLSPDCVLQRMCSLQNVFSIGCVLDRMCSLYNVFITHYILYILYRMYAL
jgi:hypothetical protein